jgi:MFS family permease
MIRWTRSLWTLHSPNMTNTGTTSISTAARQIRARRHRTGFWIIAASFLLTMAFATVPAPLYALYQRADSFPTFTLTLVFGAYAVGVAVALIFVGHLSDVHGRKKLVALALALALLSSIIFILRTDVGWLLIARFISGLAVGALTSAATAFLSELELGAAPTPRRRHGSVIAGVVNLGGLGVGALGSGAMADLVKAPLLVPYVVFAILFAAALLAVLIVPETVVISAERPAYRPQAARVPHGKARDFGSAVTASFAVFAVLGLFTSVAPTFLALTFGVTDRFLAGGATFVVFGGAAVSQVVFARRTLAAHARWGAVVIAVGLILLGIAAVVVAAWLFITASAITGVGVGLLFRAAIGAASALAMPSERGGVLATTFLVGYIGMVVPVVITGALLLVLPATSVLLGFVVVVVVLAAWAGMRLERSLGLR